MMQPHEKWLSKAEDDLKYYIPARYPDAVPGSSVVGSSSKENAEEALGAAENIYSIVKNQIGKK